jgi:hypothetical protein
MSARAYNHDEVSLPEVFRFSIDHSGPRRSVEWRNRMLVLRGCPFDDSGTDERARFSPSPMQWDQFWRAMERANVWTWRAEYFEPVLDGTSWSLEMENAGQRIESHGSNGYAGSDGSSYGEESEFAQLLRALSGLVGGQAIW